MEESYEELLDRAMSQVPDTTSKESRFKIPEVEVDISGNQTAIQNLKGIADELDRNPDHVMKYLLREVGTAGHREGSRGVFQGRFGRKSMQEKIDRYINEYVLCSECGRPDTELVKEGRVNILKCTACGARSSVGGL